MNLNIEITAHDAMEIVGTLRAAAAMLRQEAEGKIHNASLSRRDAAADLEVIADKVERQSEDQLQEASERKGRVMARHVAGRAAAARNKA